MLKISKPRLSPLQVCPHLDKMLAQTTTIDLGIDTTNVQHGFGDAASKKNFG